MIHIKTYDQLNENRDSDIYRVFVRFGKLGLMKQDGFGSNSFHAPPASKGMYAMPKRFQEMFLVGSIGITQKKYTGFKQSTPGKDSTKEEWDEHYRKRAVRMKQIRREFVVDKDVDLWHHLDVPNNEVIDRHGSWVKTSWYAWKAAVQKESVNLRARSLQQWGDDTEGEYNYQPGGINSVRKRTGAYSMDHFEVFFDTKVF